MVVMDAQTGHDELKKRGVNVTDVNRQVWDKLVHFMIRTATLGHFRNCLRVANSKPSAKKDSSAPQIIV